MSANELNVLANAFSLAISAVAMVVSIIFYIAGRNTENRVSTSLAKIEAQTDALQKLSGRQIDKLMKHAFENQGRDMNNEINHQLINVLSQLPHTITTLLIPQQRSGNNEELVTSLYIALYFYAAQTNYWSQFYLPSPSEFNPGDDFHSLVKRMVDISCGDFDHSAKVLGNYDQTVLATNPIAHLLNETKEIWRHSVRSSADVFVLNSQAKTAT